MGGRRVGAMVTVERTRRQVPTVAGAEISKVLRVIPGETRPGRRMSRTRCICHCQRRGSAAKCIGRGASGRGLAAVLRS